MANLHQKLTFHVTHSEGNRQVFPDNRLVQFSWKKDTEFNLYTFDLSGQLLFTGDDYQYFLDIENSVARCESPLITIYLNCDSGAEVFYSGLIDLNKGNWRLSRCQVSLQVEENNAVKCFKKGWVKEFNLFALGMINVPVNYFLGTLQEEVCLNDFLVPTNILQDDCIATPGDPTAGGYALKKHRVFTTLPDWWTETTWVREFVSLGQPPPGDGWIDLGGGDYARPPFTVFESFTGDIDGAFETIYTVLGEDIPEIDNAFLLTDVLDVLLANSVNNMDCELLGLVSNFFGINPDATEPTNSAYTNAADFLQHVVLWQKSDVINYDASNNATKAITSLKSIFENLKNRFNLDIGISGNTVRLEHISYFEQANGMNFENDSDLAGTNNYTYKADALPYREEFKSMDTKESIDFQGQPIEYEFCNGEALITRQTDQMSADIAEMIAFPDDFSLEGFAIANCFESGGDYYFINEIGEITGDLKLNGHLAWSNLIPTYWVYSRPLPSGDINGDLTEFETTEKIKESEFEAFLPCPSALDFDPTKNVKGLLGWGEIISANLSFPSCKFEVKLKL